MRKHWVVAGCLLLLASALVFAQIVSQRPLSPLGLTAGVGYGTTQPTLANSGSPPGDGELFVLLSSGSAPTLQIRNASASAWQSVGGGTNLLGTNNTWTGTNTFNAAVVVASTTALNGAVTIGTTNTLQLGSVAFASLGTPANGMLIYCSDCTIANPCAAAGTGAVAKRINATWICN